MKNILENLPDIALSARQPWSELIVTGAKKIEVRTWPAPEKYMGKRVAIHAGKKVDKRGFIWAHIDLDKWSEVEARTGMIIGEAILDSCMKFDCQGHFAEYQQIHLNKIEDYDDGLYGFTFTRPVIYDIPIPWRGKLNFFKVDKSDMIIQNGGKAK